MKKNILKLICLVLITMALGSCAAKKKYGCPNHISLHSFFSQL